MASSSVHIVAATSLLAIVAAAVAMATCNHREAYSARRLPLCIAPQFIRKLDVTVMQQQQQPQCALACSSQPDCRAFSLNDDGESQQPSRSQQQCTLYVWNRCSLGVRVGANCSAASGAPMVLVYIRAGGALCPNGYLSPDGSYRGYRYKAYSDPPGSWSVQAARCLADGELVRPASVDSDADADAVSARTGGFQAWTGAVQLTGAAEPSGGWYWYPCASPGSGGSNHSVQAGVWNTGEPNDNGLREDAATLLSRRLSDYPMATAYPVVCQCTDPFY